MPGIRARHLIGVLAVTVASGLLFSVSALNERRHPAATSDLATLVRTRRPDHAVRRSRRPGPRGSHPR